MFFSTVVNQAMRILLHMILVGWLMACASANATPTTGEFLKLANSGSAGRATATAYLLGAVDMADGLTLAAPTLPQYCMPENVTQEQLLAMSKRYMENSPNDWHLPAFVLIYRALQNAWPCPAK